MVLCGTLRYKCGVKMFISRLKGLKTLEAFRSGRENHHGKYVKNKERQRQRNYLILLKKDSVMEIQLCGQTLIILL